MLEQTPDGFVVDGVPLAVDLDPEALASFRAHMDDDLDTAGGLAGIFELVSVAHSAADAGQQERAEVLARTAAVLVAALGVSLRGESGEVDERPPNWRHNASRPGWPRTTPGPTPCATSWSPSGGRSRTRRRGRPSTGEAPPSSRLSRGGQAIGPGAHLAPTARR